MSSLMNPVGPDEPSTYWRRRAVVVVALLVVLWLAWWLLSSVFGGDDTAGDTPSASPTFGLSMSPEPSGSAVPEASASPGAESSGSPAPSASASAPCTDDVIKVTVATDGATAAVGAGMKLTLSVTNTGTAACARDVGPGANELRVTSGAVVVWSSDFCNASDASDVRALQPGEPWTESIAWPGTVVTQDCPTQQPTAQAGSYKATGRNGNVDSEQVSFTVQ